MNRALQVGITGGIGSGKSLVCHIFQCLGIPVYDADTHAKNLMTTNAILVEQIKKEFGPGAYHVDGSLNRKFLSQATFGHREKLEKLNNLVHPRVATDYGRWADRNQNHPYMIREAALLFEAGSYKSVDKMVVISAPEKIRIQRVLARDADRTVEGIHDIVKSQWPEEEKLKKADYIIHNDEQQLVIPQVLHLHELFKTIAKTGDA